MSITLYNQYIYKNGEWKLVGTSIDPPTKTSDLTNDSGFITAADIPVESVNGETGAVVLDAADVGAQPTITANGILKANGSGTVTAATAGTDYQAPLPSQSGNSGKYLTTNGTAMSWGEVDALPSQTGNSGKFLTTDGTDASWTSITQDDHKWGTATLDRTQEGIANDTYVPQFDSTSDTTAKLAIATKTPANYAVAKYDGSAFLHSTTPTSSDNSTKVATTEYVDTAVGAITYPVTSVNTKTGAVSLTASDVGALPDSTTIPQGTVTSVRVQATSPVQSSTNTAQSTTLNTTISLADSYGDTKNPYAAKAKNTVLAGPSTGTATAPSFRTLEADDIPSLTVSKISDFPSTMTPSSHTHGNITNAGDITTTATIASGDRLVINDESASKITNSSITFGTSETTYLTNKGTWKTPDYPVTSVNTKTGAVSLTASDVGALPSTTSIPSATSDLTNDSGFITSSDIPVTSVNTKTGAVSLSASDVGALPSTTDVTKWNGVGLTKTSSAHYSGYVPYMSATDSTSATLQAFSSTKSSGRIAAWDSSGYLYSSTPTAGDNSGKVATTKYVDSAINELGSLLTFKGVVATTGDLPGSGNDVGDVWVVSEDNSEHVWTGSAWERLGTTVDLSGYVPTSRTVNNKALSTDITLSASDVGALPSTTDLSVYMQKGVDYVTAGRKANTTAGNKSTAEGNNTTASGNTAHAEGHYTTASGSYSHAEGYYTVASGNYSSHAEGYQTTASGQYGTHAEGDHTTASGKSSHAEGTYVSATRADQHAFGRYNILDTNGAGESADGLYVEIVGNGTADNARSNARTLDWSGNEVLAGKLTVGAGPTNAMDVATKNYVDVAVASAGSGLPDQTGQSGKFLTTNGTAASWANIPLFCVTYETTPYATIKAAHDAGYLCYMINSSLIYILIQATSEVCAFTLTGESTGFSTVNIIRVTSSDVWSSTWLDAQSKITASGILKGDGSGNITAATAGFDYLTSSGFAMSGQILTSFNAAVAMGTRGSSQNTIPNLVNELRYSSGVGGSFSLTTAYTLDGVTMSTGWYNYLWIPHRSGGVNGEPSGDNCDYGMLLMNAMTGSYGCFMLRYTSGSIAELKQLDAGGLPSQSGQSGKFLTTNGTTASWTSLPVYNGSVV